MPKTRRGGQKYHLRKITAQLYAPPPRNHLLGIEYTSDSEDEISRVSNTNNLQCYKLIPIEVPAATFNPTAIPESDPRYGAYMSIVNQDSK